MRRLFFSVVALSFVGAMFGCHHVAGVCDCDPDPDPCWLLGSAKGLGGTLHTNGKAPPPETGEPWLAPSNKK